VLAFLIQLWFKVGQLQAYNLGIFLRRRYKDFISPVYQPGEVTVLSSDLERTVVSAEMVLAGLYKTKNAYGNNNDTLLARTDTVKEIPIQTIPIVEDNVSSFDE